MLNRKHFLIAPLLGTLLMLSAPASAEDVPLVAGKLWNQSSLTEKKSYLVGASNLISLEYTYQASSENPPTERQSTMPKFHAKTENVTLDQAIAAIDRWYQAHPDNMNQPVLAVVWLTLVEPKQ